MSNGLAKAEAKWSRAAGEALERVLVAGDLKELSAEQRLEYYQRLCESLGLNPLTRPFQYITLNGKLVLYAARDCTDQLRRVHEVSIEITSREVMEDVYVVTARARTEGGRTDESIGAVTIGNLKGDMRANAMMKAETKAKRRVTLSICGLGLMDETETETVPEAIHVEVTDKGEIVQTAKDEPYFPEDIDAALLKARTRIASFTAKPAVTNWAKKHKDHIKAKGEAFALAVRGYCQQHIKLLEDEAAEGTHHDYMEATDGD